MELKFYTLLSILSLVSFLWQTQNKTEHLPLYETLNSIRSDNRTSDYIEIICMNCKLTSWKVCLRFYIIMVIQF